MIEQSLRRRTLFREVNERIRELSRRFGGAASDYEFLCECTRPDCLLRVEIPGGVYDQIVADRERFVVAAGHEETAEALAAA
ncbi:MAG: hypothetical protein QOE43_428 [Gaiellaceae bacterium]|nr:hypothetical protein [Gaiellaceae bacterium]